MSLSSVYGRTRTVDVTFNDDTYVTISINIPMDLIGYVDKTTDRFIPYDDSNNRQKEYVRNWIKRNLQNVKKKLLMIGMNKLWI
jgi:hypothetical protein